MPDDKTSMARTDKPGIEAGPSLVLASASPRRAALLREYGYAFDVVPPPLDEPQSLKPGLSPAQLAEALSYFKARSVAELRPASWVLGGDTVVALDRRIFGKPVDRDDAREILLAVSGTTHHVITGVALIEPGGGRRTVGHDETAVTMRRLADEELEAYLDTGAWKGKAGAYGIQDHGDAFVTNLVGSFTNVVGFPMELVTRMLRERGIAPVTPGSRA